MHPLYVFKPGGLCPPRKDKILFLRFLCRVSPQNSGEGEQQVFQSRDENETEILPFPFQR